MDITFSKGKLAAAGALCGVIAAVLAFAGNPANMAFCIACFIRDTAGAMGFHQAAAVQYARPEIVGLIIGAFIISVMTKEYRSTAGSSPMIRFLPGMILMIGTLVFLGCPLRMVLRMSAGDLNAFVALAGFIAGVGTGAAALKQGFSLGRAHSTNAPSGGVMAQKSRMCFAGSLRDIFIMKNFDLLCVILGLFSVMLVYNLTAGHFTPGFYVPGVIAHPQHLWNFLGMYAVGFAAVLAGGCPLRQLILAGQGSCDAAVTVLGMFVASAVCHNFGLAASGTSRNDAGELVIGAVPVNGKIALVICIVLLFVIAFTQKRKKA